MKINHIYWFAPYNLTCPSTRYRGKYPLDFFRLKHGVTVDFIMPNFTFRSIWYFIKTVIKILFFQKKNSLIVIQKVITNRFYANCLKVLVLIKKQGILYDIDDAEYYRTDTKTLHFFLENCTTIQVGSEALRQYCLKFNKNVFVNTSPIIKHQLIKKQRNKVLTIGWVGDTGNGKTPSFSHRNNLFLILFPSLLLIKIPIKLVLIGVKQNADIQLIKSYFETKDNIELVIPTNLDWKNDKWLYPMIQKFDIGVSPMTNHPFHQAKSAFKAKQYLSCGVPTIASNVGENATFVHHHQNGFLCEKSESFEKYIHQINEMNSLEYDQLIKHSLLGKSTFSVEGYVERLINYIKNS